MGARYLDLATGRTRVLLVMLARASCKRFLMCRNRDSYNQLYQGDIAEEHKSKLSHEVVAGTIRSFSESLVLSLFFCPETKRATDYSLTLDRPSLMGHAFDWKLLHVPICECLTASLNLQEALLSSPCTSEILTLMQNR